MNLMIIAGILFVVALAGYAGYLHWRLWQLRRQHSRVEKAVPGAENNAGVVRSVTPAKRSDNLVAAEKGIYLLSEAMLDNRLTHTEGCMRICALAYRLDDTEKFRRDYSVFFRVAEATAHIPILEDWQALSRAEKKALGAQRLEVERRHQKEILEAVQRIRVSYK